VFERHTKTPVEPSNRGFVLRGRCHPALYGQVRVAPGTHLRETHKLDPERKFVRLLVSYRFVAFSSSGENATA
jgi:hypothetical protein